MRTLLTLIAISVASFTAIAQSIDERIGEAMNSGDNFGLYDIYHSAPKDSIDPFLEVFSRCLIGNRFNRPDISIPAFDELLKTQSDNLDLGLLLQSGAMYSMDLSRVRRNEDAYNVLSAILSAAYTTVDSISLSTYADMAAQYKALTAYSPYQISFNGDEGRIPFDFITAGKAESGQCLMQITGAEINGNSANITFDTGAGVNVITDSLAQAYNLTFLDADVATSGVATSTGRYAIARELKLGNITVRDVPFYVIDISSHNEEADQYMSVLQLMVGSELMLQLKDVTIDFAAKRIEVPVEAPKPSDVRPNMSFSSGMNLLATADINGHPLLITLDTGAASYGSLNHEYYEHNREYITANCQSDTIRHAGVGGVWSSLCYRLPEAELNLGGNSVIIPTLTVQTEQPSASTLYDNNLGLRSMMLYRRIRFNLTDMLLTTEL